MSGGPALRLSGMDGHFGLWILMTMFCNNNNNNNNEISKITKIAQAVFCDCIVIECVIAIVVGFG